MHVTSNRVTHHAALGMRPATVTPGGVERTLRRRLMTLRAGVLLAVLAFLQGVLAETGPTSVDVTFASGAIELAGTLTLPGGPGPHPALVTITGSGPQDRDNAHPSIPDYRPFAWLAERLQELGVAVLRFDERGVGESGGEFAGATSHDLSLDVEAALRYLRTRPEVDADRLGLIGHSEGSMIAGMIAARDPEVAFAISLAGAGVDGFTLMRTQIANLAFTQAPSEAFAQHVVQTEIRALELALAEDWEALEEHFFDAYQVQFGMLPEEGRPPADQIAPLARQTAQQAATRYQDRWFQFFLRHDPGQDWERVSVPVLAVFAEHDLQVDPELNRAALREAFERAGNEDATIATLERANHLFLESETGDALEYAELEMAFAPGFVDLITAWLAEHVLE